MPAPIIMACLLSVTGVGISSQLGLRIVACVNVAVIISRLRPKPFCLVTLKPTCSKALLTAPAALKVLSVVAVWLNLAMCCSKFNCQKSGFLSGAKPSKNHASTCALSCGNSSLASPNNSVKVMLTSANTNLCQPATKGGYWANNCVA